MLGDADDGNEGDDGGGGGGGVYVCGMCVCVNRISHLRFTHQVNDILTHRISSLEACISLSSLFI